MLYETELFLEKFCEKKLFPVFNAPKKPPQLLFWESAHGGGKGIFLFFFSFNIIHKNHTSIPYARMPTRDFFWP